MQRTINVNAVIDRAKSIFGVQSDAALGEAIGLSRSAVSVWRSRRMVSYSALIQTMPTGTDFHWLLTGESTSAAQSAPAPDTLAELSSTVKELTAKIEILNTAISAVAIAAQQITGKRDEAFPDGSVGAAPQP